MIGTNLKKSFAVFVIALFVFAPIYISSVYASLTYDYAYGSAKNDGWVKKYDDLYISVLTDNTNPDKIKLNGIEFNSCSEGKCYLTLKDYTFYNSPWKRIVKNDDTGETIPIELTIDSIIPSETKFDISQDGNTIFVDYDFDDSNFQKIDFYTNNNLVKTSVEKTGTEELIVTDGAYNVKAIVFDEAGNTLTSSGSINVDLTSPKITDVSFLYNNNEIDWTNGEILRGVNVVVKYNEKIMGDSCYADLSALASSLFASTYSNYAGVASGDFCVYSGLIFDKQDGNSKTFSFKARDLIGNVGEESYSKTFQYDSEAPVAQSLETQYVDADGKNWIASSVGDDLELKLNTNRLYFKFSESGSGISASRMYVDLENIYSEGVNCTYLASNCGSSSCEFLIPIKNGNSLKDGTIVIPYYSTDNAGNSFDGDVQLDVYVDDKAPVIEDYSVFTTNGEYDCTIGECKQGDSIKITLNVTDEGAPADSIEVYGDLSKVGGYEDDSFSCSKNTTHKFTCTKTINDVIGPFTDINIPITLKDIVGNVNVDDENVSFDVAVYDYDSDGVPVFWQFDVNEEDNWEIIPQEGIDVGVTLPYDLFYWFKITEYSGCGNYNCDEDSLTILKIEKGQDNANDNFDVISETILKNANLNNKQENYLILKPTESPETELAKYKMNTTLTITTRYQEQTSNNYHITVQTINMTGIEIPIYDNPMGSIEDNTQQKIDAVRNGWLVKGGWIQATNNIFVTIQRLCQTLAAIRSVSVAVDTLASIFSVIPATNSFGKTLFGVSEWISGASWSKPVQKIIGTSCSAVSCSLPLDEVIANAIDENTRYGTSVSEAWGEFLQATQGKDNWRQIWDPMNSIPGAILQGCIPGVINNLQKARQIECQYVYCMENQVKGDTAYQIQCDKLRSYEWCTYIYGQLYSLMFGDFIEQIKNDLIMVSIDPISLVLGSAYHLTCTTRLAWNGGAGQKIVWGVTSLTYLLEIGMFFGDLIGEITETPDDNDLKKLGLSTADIALITAAILGITAGKQAAGGAGIDLWANSCSELKEMIDIKTSINQFIDSVTNADDLADAWNNPEADYCSLIDLEEETDNEE